MKNTRPSKGRVLVVGSSIALGKNYNAVFGTRMIRTIQKKEDDHEVNQTNLASSLKSQYGGLDAKRLEFIRCFYIFNSFV